MTSFYPWAKRGLYYWLTHGFKFHREEIIMKHLTTLKELEINEITEILDRAGDFKKVSKKRTQIPFLQTFFLSHQQEPKTHSSWLKRNWGFRILI